MDRKIGVIGRIDPAGVLFDGQTVKTRTVWRMLCGHYGADNIIPVETLNYKKEPFRVVREYRRCMKECDDVVVLLSRNGRSLFFPFLKRQAKCNGKRIYHDLIGGLLAQDLQREPWLVSQLNSFEVNWVESRDLMQQLKQLGVQNCEYLPNFKQINVLNPSELPKIEVSPRRLCTFSRVTEKKGILEAIEAVENLCILDGSGSWHLDIYGPIDPGFRTIFERALSASANARYCGTVDPEDSVDILKKYWALLFPTKWSAEGFPGTILDALSAGLPIVASRWRYYDEILEDNVTGTSYDAKRGSVGLLDAIRKLELLESSFFEMKCACLSRANGHSRDSLFKQMVNRMDRAYDISHCRSQK